MAQHVALLIAELLKHLKREDFEISQNETYRVDIRVNRSFDCPVCQTNHSTDNMFAVIGLKHITLNCYSNSQRQSIKKPKIRIEVV